MKVGIGKRERLAEIEQTNANLKDICRLLILSKKGVARRYIVKE
jgi:hypothetical protein